jgi:hypothetical protein
MFLNEGVIATHSCLRVYGEDAMPRAEGKEAHLDHH